MSFEVQYHLKARCLIVESSDITGSDRQWWNGASVLRFMTSSENESIKNSKLVNSELFFFFVKNIMIIYRINFPSILVCFSRTCYAETNPEMFLPHTFFSIGLIFLFPNLYVVFCFLYVYYCPENSILFCLTK